MQWDLCDIVLLGRISYYSRAVCRYLISIWEAFVLLPNLDHCLVSNCFYCSRLTFIVPSMGFVALGNSHNGFLIWTVQESTWISQHPTNIQLNSQMEWESCSHFVTQLWETQLDGIIPRQHPLIYYLTKYLQSNKDAPVYKITEFICL